METFLFEQRSVLPCRENQLLQIYSYIGNIDEPVPHCLFLYGNAATGKTACLINTLEYLSYRYVVLNAVECYTQKIIYETILNKLSGHVPSRDNKYMSVFKCDNIKDFVAQLNFMFEKYSYEPVIIVFDNASRLRDMEHNILPAFLRLKEFCNLNVCTILVSDIPFEKYLLKTGLKEPIKIFFPQYTKEELYNIILTNQAQCANYALQKLERNSKFKNDILRHDVFANYLNAFLSVFYRPCRDLVELKHMARLNYVEYCEPILNGSIEADDVTKLWRYIAPILKSSLEILYLRLNGTNNHLNQTGDPCYEIQLKMESLDLTKEEVVKEGEQILTNEMMSTETFAQSFELPFYAKFLLIAAYLASFNPAKEDKRLFMKYHGKKKKRMQLVNANAKLAERLNIQLGPRVFTLDRMLAIFYAILEERAGLTANLLAQISSLVRLRLLTASTDCMRYKCTVSYEFIAAISKMVGFNIRKYLYDFI
ncbi:origin recognition complex subunit 5 [Arctopsyche grandis]|uniref:origin recognition complex subunit 5 n=1 Tax=Arctopsyche grandis TaxID=121162 RepID=UPI00406D9E3A